MPAPPPAPSALMPTWSPPFGVPPYPMLSAELLLVEFEVDRAAIEAMTPAPLEPADHNRISAFVGECAQMTHSYRYHEVAIVQPVTYEGKPAVTVPYIWTSTDTALLAGRELYGMPKMLCDDDGLHIHANEVTGYLHRGGTEMMALSMASQEAGNPVTLPFGADFTFVRHIPSPDPAVPARQQLLWITLEDFAIEFLLQGQGHVQMGHPLSSGLGALHPKNVCDAWHGKFTWTLPHAKILKEWDVSS